MRRVSRTALVPLSLVLALVPVGVARGQGEPVMPLAEVRPGLPCEGASVVRGTTISSFAVEILDVVAGDGSADRPRILFRASGPAIDPTGIGPGFSGSPIRCLSAPGGPPRIIGAISEGIGEFGGKVALATPIEQIIGTPVDAPVSATRAPALLRRARPLSAPLTITGLSGPMASLLRRAAVRAKRPLAVAPATGFRAGVPFPPQPLVPGAAVSAGLTSGALVLGAIGTVAYADGDRVWAFGHPLDGVGRRSLFLQDAFVHAVVNNPLGSPDLSTYKLASPGNDVGTLSNDANNAIVGRVGALPPRFPLRIVATDLDRGRTRVHEILVADEADIGLPTGSSALTIAAPAAVGNAALAALDSGPVRQSGEMCVRIELRERRAPLRFCNRYVGGGPGPNGAAIADVGAAVGLVDAYELEVLHVERMEINLKLRRSFPQATLLSVAAPEVARRGTTIPVRLTMRVLRGPKVTRTIRVRIPRGVPVGERRLQLDGASADSGGAEDALTEIIDLGDIAPDGEEQGGPKTVTELAKAVSDLGRYDGLLASFPPPGTITVSDELAELLGDEGGGEDLGPGERIAQRQREVYRDKRLRIGGRGRANILVVP